MSDPSNNEQSTKRTNKFLQFVGTTLGLRTWSTVFRTAIGSPRRHLDHGINVFKALKETGDKARKLPDTPDTPETVNQGQKHMKVRIGVFTLFCAFTLFNFVTATGLFAKISNGALFVVFLVNIVFCYVALRNITTRKNSQ